MKGDFYDPLTLDFFLNELDLIERNATQFDEKFGESNGKFLRTFVNGQGIELEDVVSSGVFWEKERLNVVIITCKVWVRLVVRSVFLTRNILECKFLNLKL